MTRNDLSGYEQRLLGELRTLVEARAAEPAALPAPAPVRRRPPRLALAGLTCALALAAVVVPSSRCATLLCPRSCFAGVKRGSLHVIPAGT